MNDMYYKKESISAVMRAFMLKNEIVRKQQLINFVGGSSLLLRRYCEPLEPWTDFFVAKPGLRSNFFEMLARQVRSGSVYERLKCGTGSELSVETVAESETRVNALAESTAPFPTKTCRSQKNSAD